MVFIVDRTNAAYFRAQIERMHRVRKRVFVDTMGWKVPVVNGALEIDEFDDENAVYLINTDQESGDHLASVRLLASSGPHVLGNLFDDLCEGGAPRNATTWEITRLCATPGLEREVATKARHKLAVALVEYALLHGIHEYTCVIEVQHISALIAPGWASRPLGAPKEVDGALIGAFALAMTPTTLDLMVKRWGGMLPVLQYRGLEAA